MRDRSSFDPDRTVTPRRAATVVLVRPAPSGIEVLLVRRPTTMAFAADVHAFPGGAVDPGDASPEAAAIRELEEEVGVRVDGPSALIPLSRWVTPVGYPRRFDTSFFAAALPDDAEPVAVSDELAAIRWIAPGAALEAMRAGDLPMWLPTTTTLQQLAHVRSVDEIGKRLRAGIAGPLRVDRPAPDVVRFVLPAAGAVPGQVANAYLVGRGSRVLVDPGDPSPDVVAAILRAAGEDGGRIEAVALTHADPDHAAGAESIAERLSVPVLVGPGGGAPLPFGVVELEDGERLPAGDRPMIARFTPGHRPDHLAFELGEGVWLAGDLVGEGPSRSVLAPPDEAAAARSLDRVTRAGARLLLPGHGEPAPPSS